MLPAVVLTAGLGTRLDPLTRIVAKPAVPVGRRTLVEHVLVWLREQGVEDLVLNLHHRPETITGVLGDGAHLGLRIRYSWEQPILGSAGGPKRALKLLSTQPGEPFLIVNGDTLCPIDLAPMIAAHRESGAAVTMAVVPNPSLRRYNGILLDESDRIVRFVAKDPSGALEAERRTWHFVGIQIASSNVFDRLVDGVPAETTSELYLRLLEEAAGSLRAWKVHDRFVDVGTPRDYLEAVNAASAGAEATTVSGRLANSVVWPGARVAPDVELDECVVAGPVVLPAGFRARQSVLVPAALLGPDEAIPTIGDVAVFPLA
jgi:mannose-1-phosphate guanylyltransferase